MIGTVVDDTTVILDNLSSSGSEPHWFTFVAILFFAYILFLFGFVIYRLIVPPKIKNGD